MGSEIRKTASKDDLPMATMSPRSRKNFFENLLLKHKDLCKSQREYVNVLNSRLKTRSQIMTEKSCAIGIDRLQNERNDLRAQIWVANGRCHTSADEKYLEQIQCHIKCQERLNKDIGNLKKIVDNLQREKRRVDKQIYELNRKTIADSQHQEYVAHVRKQIQILENRVEIGVRHECGITAANAALREEFRTLLAHRERFNEMYKKSVQKLYADKKYLMDMLEFACHAYEGGIDMQEKILNSKLKTSKESEKAKLKVQSIMRKSAAAELVTGFMNCKNQTRPLADLQPSEYKRRTNFRHKHIQKITLYNTVLSKLFEYTFSHNVDGVIDKYQQHESLYHSYFSYANRTSYLLTTLTSTVDRLYMRVSTLKQKSRTGLSNQHERIRELQAKLEEQLKQNALLRAQTRANEKHLQQFFGEISLIFNMCMTDPTPLMAFLGNHTRIHLDNLHLFLRALEERILNIVRNVYMKEHVLQKKPFDQCVVKDLIKYRENPTDIDDIVLTQQCPECAEGEIFNIDDGSKNGIDVLGIEDAKKKLSEVVNQPEMQYRLHSISDCRLPKSRMLAAKRHISK